MDTSELPKHSFVVRMWVVETGDSREPFSFRGSVRDVSTGERRYFKDLAELLQFFAPYLEQMRVQLPVTWRIRRWLGSRSKAGSA